MLVTSSKLNQTKFAEILIKKHHLSTLHSSLLKDVVSILPICKNKYNHYDINMIEHFFVYPIILNQQISVYENTELKGFITYAMLDKIAEKMWKIQKIQKMWKM